MEKDKKAKLSLPLLIIFILIVIIIAMAFCIYDLAMDKYYMASGASQQIEELNTKIKDLENKNTDNIEVENIEKAENNIIKYNNTYFLDNGQITKINENTSLFSSKDLGITFQYPSKFEIQYTNDNFIIIDTFNSLVSMKIDMTKNDYSEWLNYYKNSPWATTILKEGDIEISNYKAHYFRCNVGNGPDDYEDKIIFIKTDNNNGYIANFSVDIGDYDMEIVDYKKISKRQDENYNEYELIFDKIISTLKFES